VPLPTFVFTLNNQPMSILEGQGRKFAAFSGTGAEINNFNAVSHANTGPLPTGLYYIVDRESGGRLGHLRDAIHNQSSGSDNNDWFGLYRGDGKIDDWTFVSGVKRGNFRLHPAGVRRISYGCITLPSKIEFYRLRDSLRNTAIIYKIPGTGTRYYGTILVKADESLTTMPSFARHGGR